MSKLKKVGGVKPKKLDDKTIFQKLLPGCFLLIISTVVGFSIKYMVGCNSSCVWGGIGVGSSGLTLLYVIAKGLKDYGVF